MNRRTFAGLGSSALVVAGTGGLFATTLGFKGCGETPGQLSKWTQQVIAGLTEARAVFVDAALGNVVELVDKAIEIAKNLKKAFDAGVGADALTYLALLLAPEGILQSIALAVGLLQNEAQRRVVATVLIVARLALNLIAANLQTVAAAQPGGVSEAKNKARAAGKGAQVDAVETAAGSKILSRTFEIAYGVKLN